MVEPEAEQPRNRLGAEPRGGSQLGVACGDPDPACRRQEPERPHELGVELAHRDESRRIGRRCGGLAPRGERVGELAPRQRVGRPEGGRVGAEDPDRRDGPDLGAGPGGRGRRRRVAVGGLDRLHRPGGTGGAEGDENRREQRESTPHTLCIGR